MIKSLHEGFNNSWIMRTPVVKFPDSEGEILEMLLLCEELLDRLNNRKTVKLGMSMAGIKNLRKALSLITETREEFDTFSDNEDQF